MYLKPCTSQKVVEFINFVIKQSIPLELAKQVGPIISRIFKTCQLNK